MKPRLNVKPRHKAVAKELRRQVLEHDYKPIGETLGKFGNYSMVTANKNPKAIMETDAMKEALRHEGLNVEDTDNVVKGIMNAPKIAEMITPDNVLRAADMVYKRLGAYKGDDNGSKTLNLFVFAPEQAKAIAERIVKNLPISKE